MEVLSDIEIARRNEMAPIEDIAQKINLNPEGLIKFGTVSYTHLTLPTNREV